MSKAIADMTPAELRNEGAALACQIHDLEQALKTVGPVLDVATAGILRDRLAPLRQRRDEVTGAQREQANRDYPSLELVDIAFHDRYSVHCSYEGEGVTAIPEGYGDTTGDIYPDEIDRLIEWLQGWRDHQAKRKGWVR